MRSGFWRHINCLDIDVEVVKIQYRGPTYIKARVIYWRRACGKSPAFMIFPRPETVKIFRSQLPNWKPLIS